MALRAEAHRAAYQTAWAWRAKPKRSSNTEQALSPPYGARPVGRRSPRAEAGAHVVEQGRRRPAVQLQAIGLLVGAKRRARQHAGLAVELVGIEAEFGEPALHRLDVGGAQLRGLAPRRLERARIEHAVAQVADEQHIEVGEIVVLDDVVVLRRQERWPVGALRHQQRRRLCELVGREFSAVGRYEAALHPLAD